MHTKKRTPTAVRLNSHRRRLYIDIALRLYSFCKALDGPSLQQNREVDFLVELLSDLCDQTKGEQRVSAQREEVICDFDWVDIQNILLNMNQVELQFSSRLLIGIFVSLMVMVE